MELLRQAACSSLPKYHYLVRPTLLGTPCLRCPALSFRILAVCFMLVLCLLRPLPTGASQPIDSVELEAEPGLPAARRQHAGEGPPAHGREVSGEACRYEGVLKVPPTTRHGTALWAIVLLTQLGRSFIHDLHATPIHTTSLCDSPTHMTFCLLRCVLARTAAGRGERCAPLSHLDPRGQPRHQPDGRDACGALRLVMEPK